MTGRDDAGEGRPVRAAVLVAQPGRLEQGTSRVLLRAGVERVLSLRADDARRFGERAQALRDAHPDVVLVPVADRGGANELAFLAEPLRFGCAAQRPVPRVLLASGDDGAIARAQTLLAPFPLDVVPDVRTEAGGLRAAAALRRMRGEGVLRDDALERLATRVARACAQAVLVVDVGSASTSLVRADPAGTLLAVHVRPLGVGVAADRLVARAGIDRVRRWIPWAVDQPTLLERVFNRARWPGAVPTDRESLAVEIALAHEAVGHAAADADAAGIGVLLRSATTVLLTGRLAGLAASQASLVAADSLDLAAAATIARDEGDGLVSRAARTIAAGDDAELDGALPGGLRALASLIPVATARRTTLRISCQGVLREERVDRGAFYALRVAGALNVDGAGVIGTQVASGPVGAIVDARPRPLTLPARDAERVPAVAGWYEAVGALPGAAAAAAEGPA